ncbi:MAG TPA: Smr/MutS family protein [Ferruginibacter sp.]|mgnify:CR=1 FL=1|nr:Smr/MutS family protein [Ferruginibacter sp.]HRO06086.1 Smr/MutS family protein [Ferruginibacter sp.]HRO96808.1 Smr/MutS family protein [Ferruginibacter sp.]HRP50413.1 Smr/MutS family protein [Ferruginibacter sp.]
MKFEIGDKVVVKHTGEKGVIVDVINHEMMMVENDKGVRFPVFTDQLDFPYYDMFTKPKPVPAPKTVYVDQIKKEKNPASPSDTTGVYLSFLPVLDKDVFDDDIVERLKIYLVNHNKEDYHFVYRYLVNNQPAFDLENTLRAGSRFYVHDIDFEQLNDSIKFNVEFSLTEKDKRRAPYHEAQLKPGGKQLFKRIQDTLGKQEASFAYTLFEEYPAKVQEAVMDLSKLQQSGFKVYDAKEGSRHLPPARSVVDLHIERLTDDYHTMKPSEILDVQMRAFETWYDIAVGHRLDSMIFIHGVGEGVLKQSIHEALKLKREVRSFTDATHPKYGSGATEVFFKK